MEKENRTTWISRVVVWALILGMAGIIYNMLMLERLPKTERSPVSRVKADMRTLATGLETYWLEYDSYPACGKDDMGVNAFLRKKSPARQIYTFRIKREGEYFAMLTTPVAFVTTLPSDIFVKAKGAAFGYYTDGPGWIMFSPGPDFDYDLDPVKYYDSSIPQPSLEILLFHYDPSNGTVSGGDIFRVKQ